MKHEGKPNRAVSFGQPGPGKDMSAAEALSMMSGGQAFGMTKTDDGHVTAIAVQIPRNLEQVEREVIVEATMMGEDFIYAWDVDTKEGKKERIEGLSIEGAMILARNWGNCTVPTRKVDETASHFEFEAKFIDYEKGFSVTRGFRQRKSQRVGKMGAERAEDIAYQIGWSKAQRNAINQGIPAWLKEKAMAAAKDAAVKRYAKDMPKARADVKEYANGLGITDAELEAKIGTTIENWIPTDIVYIRSVFRSISKKETTIGLEFRPTPPAEESKPAETTAPTEAPDAPATSDFPDLKSMFTPDKGAAPPVPPVAAPPPPTPSEVAPATAPAPAPPPTPAPEPTPTFEPPTKTKK